MLAKVGILYIMCRRIVTKTLEMRELNRKRVSRKFDSRPNKMHVVYPSYNLENFSQQKAYLEHTVAIDEISTASIKRTTRKNCSNQV